MAVEQVVELAGRNAADARVGIACHSSPHYGGAVVYTAETS